MRDLAGHLGLTTQKWGRTFMDKLSDFQADLLSDLLNHEGWKLVQQIIDDRVADRQRQLLSGRAESLEEYQALCGSIRELLYLRDRPMQLVEKTRRAT